VVAAAAVLREQVERPAADVRTCPIDSDPDWAAAQIPACSGRRSGGAGWMRHHCLASLDLVRVVGPSGPEEVAAKPGCFEARAAAAVRWTIRPTHETRE
jgi:hypothetical protein